MTDMEKVPLNIDYWASMYPVYTDYAGEYDEALEHPRLVNRARHLWDWKGLNRAIPFKEISSVIEGLDRDDYINQGSEEAIESLSDYLNDKGVIGSNGIVTSAFLLHLMASEPDQYSAKFPIYDRRVWNAYVYLWRVRGIGEELYAQASTSPSQYSSFSRTFSRTCPDGEARDYERALFMFGGFIMNLPPKNGPTPIEKIDEKLENQETALSKMYESSGWTLTNLSETQ